MGFDLAKVQGAIRQQGGDGWLFCDIGRRDGIAYRVLGLDLSRMTTRRWSYFVPAQGTPKKLLHRVERNRLDGLPGEAQLYVGWKELHERLLIDLWARENVPEGIYYDITWCGFMGGHPDEEYRRLFGVVVQARNLTKEFIARRIADGKPVFGWEADDVCRGFIAGQGLAEYFVHRTGHSIHKTVHGNGVNLDNLETRDDREIISGTCFSIEPGITRGEIGVRSEIDVLVDHQRNVLVVGPEQRGLALAG